MAEKPWLSDAPGDAGVAPALPAPAPGDAAAAAPDLAKPWLSDAPEGSGAALPPPPQPMAPQSGDGSVTRPTPGEDGFMSRTWHALKDMVTGESRTEFPAMPEVTGMPMDVPGQTVGGATRMAGAYMLGAGQDALADIALKAYPGSEVTQDKFGNKILNFQGKSYYLSKPGLSAADLGRAIGDVASYGGAAAAVGGIPYLAGRGVLSMIPRAIAQGAGAGAVSVGEQAATVPLGSEQGVSAGQAGETALGGALAEPVTVALGKTAGWLGSTIANAARDAWASIGGGGTLLTAGSRDLAGTAPGAANALTKTGKYVFDKAGLDPANYTLDQIRTMETAFSGGAAPNMTPEQTRAAIRGGQFGIKLPVGAITQDPVQLALEDQIRNRLTLGRGNEMFRQLGEQQRQQTEAAASNIVTGMGGPGSVLNLAPGTVASEGEIGGQLANQLNARAAALRTATSNAYSQVPALASTGPNLPAGTPWFTSGASNSLLQGLQEVGNQRSLVEGMEPAMRARETIARLVTDTAQGGEGAVNQVLGMIDRPYSQPVLGQMQGAQLQTKPFNLRDLDTATKELNAQYQTAQASGNQATIGYVRHVRATLENAIDNATANGLMTGDPNQLTLLRQARAAARTEGEFLRPDSEVAHNFMDKITSGDLSGQEVVNLLYGAGEIGSKSGVNALLNHIQTTAGIGSPEWNALREAAARRILFGSQEWSAQMSPAGIANQIAKRINEAVNGNGQAITQRLMSPAEIGQLNDFRNTMLDLGKTVKQNVSGTAYVGKQIADFANRFNMISKHFGDQALAEMQARRAVSGVVPRQVTRSASELPASYLRRQVLPAAGAVAGQQGQVLPGISAAVTPVTGLLGM